MSVILATLFFYSIFGILGLIGYDSDRDSRADGKQRGYFRNLNIATVLVFLFLVASQT